MKKLIFFVILSVFALMIFRFNSKYTTVKTGNLTIIAEIADSPIEHSKGLMFRKNLDLNKGMLFIFDDEDYRTFWMKNTLIPLDMVFIDDNMTVVDKTTMQPCKNDPCPTYTSEFPAKYVLEVNSGVAQSIEMGSKISFQQAISN